MPVNGQQWTQVGQEALSIRDVSLKWMQMKYVEFFQSCQVHIVCLSKNQVGNYEKQRYTKWADSELRARETPNPVW